MRIRLPAAYKPAAFYLLATLPVFLPLLAPGYILVLDMVFAPHIPMPEDVSNTYPLYALLHMLNLFIPAWIIQKLLLVSIFAGAGISAFTLIRSLRPKELDDKSAEFWTIASYFAGIFFMYNPFVYTRLMAGQYLVLIGYALLPFFVRAMWAFVDKPGPKNCLWVIGLTTAIAVTSIHTLVVAAVIALVLLGISCCSRQGRKRWKRLLAYAAAAVGGVVVLNSFWLVPLVIGKSSLGSTVANFGSGDFTAFQTVPGDFGTIGNILALQGFWGDEQNLYLLPQDVLNLWWLPAGLLLILVAFGVAWSWCHQRRVCVAFVVSGIIGIGLAAGTAGSIFAPINQWLADHLPMFSGYREPQKAVALLVLAYAYFGACGSFLMLRRAQQATQKCMTIGALFLLPVACTTMILWGAKSQLHAQDYPRDWYAINQTLNARRAPGEKALFLPWHLYQPFTFSSGTVATPAEAFFDIPIISSKDPELEGASPYKNDADIEKANNLVKAAASARAPDTSIPGRQQAAARLRLSQQLASLDIRYILVSKNYDYEKYSFLQDTKGMTLISDTKTLRLYKIIQ